MNNSCAELDFTLFKNEKIPEGKSFKTTTLDFINLFKQPKIRSSKEGSPLIGPYTLNDSLRRKNENVESVTMLVFDIDDTEGKTLDDIYELVKDYMGFIHTSYNHIEQNPKCRIFLFLESPIPKDKFQTVRNNFLSIHVELNKIIDQSCKEISRGYFIFACPKKRKELARSKVLEGKLLNWKNYEQNFPESTNDLDIVKEGYRYPERLKLIGKLIRQGLPLEEVRKKVLK